MNKLLHALQHNTVLARLKECVRAAMPKGMKTSWWLIKITIPVSLGVLLLDYYGILDIFARYTEPVFKHMGLPGVSAVVLITSIFTNVYSVVAVLTTLHLPMREGMIIAFMCLVSHGFIIETAVLKKTGSSALRMILLRLICSFIIGWAMNLILPGVASTAYISGNRSHGEFSAAFYSWLSSITRTTIKIIILVNVLLIFQKILETFGLIRLLERPLSPLLRIMGLPKKTTLSWIVAYLIGLAYGSAIMISLVEEGKLSKADADLLNHHIAVSHSQLEDPLLFLTLGYAIYWLIWPRIILAIIVVWLRKAELYYFSTIRSKKMIPSE
ncbi:MAG: nucleoside recognition domain-containing protein [Bacteroidota bacterium]|nr:nucleoside recognition domain-containing protein [Bacteroidota bacterium]